MKYGIITDVHSNPLALKTVLKKFEEVKVDKILCAGDMIGIGPEPEETVKILLDRPRIIRLALLTSYSYTFYQIY